MPRPSSALSLRFAAVAVAGLAVALVGGLAITSGRSSAPPDRSAGCEFHQLRYGVTDDRGEAAAQRRFESALTVGGANLPAPGMHASLPPLAGTMHAASHGYGVIFYRPPADADAPRELRALDAAARATQAPVLIAPRRQRAALTAMAGGIQAVCPDGGPAQARSLRAFAASTYASVAAS